LHTYAGQAKFFFPIKKVIKTVSLSDWLFFEKPIELYLNLYNKILQIRNLREIDKFRSKLASSGLDKHTGTLASKNKHTSLLRCPFITNS
jgi:hypothetical protein